MQVAARILEREAVKRVPHLLAELLGDTTFEALQPHEDQRVDFINR